MLGGLLVVQAATPPPVVPAGFSSRGDGARTGVVSTIEVPPPQAVAWRAPVELPPLLPPGSDVLGTTEADGREVVVVHLPAADGQRITTHDAADGTVVATSMLPLGAQPYDTSIGAGLLAHRDLRTVTLVDLATGARRWTVEQALREDTAVTPFGVVGVASDDDLLNVVLLDLEDGTERWRNEREVRGEVTSILHAGSTLVITGHEGEEPFLLGLDPATGAQRWIRRGVAELRPPSFPPPPPVTDGDQILLAGGRRLVLIDATDGTLTEVALPEAVFAATGDIDDGWAIVSDGGRELVGLRLTDGSAQVEWRTTVGQPPLLAIDVNGPLTAVRTDSRTILLETATGNTVRRVAPGGGTPRLKLTEAGAVARVTPDGHVESIDSTGVVWRAPTVAVHLPDLATDDGAVAVTTPDGVQVHDVATGDQRFAHRAFEPDLVTAGSLTAPTLLAGRVVVAPPLTQPTDRGGVFALFADTGIVDWARREDRVVPRGSPVVDRDLLVLPVGSQLLGFDRVTGRRALVVETTIARADVAASGDWLVAVDAPRDGGDVWVGRRSTRDMVYRAPIRTCAPPVVHDQLVIVVTHLGDLIARQLEDGEQPWGERTGGGACRPLSIVGDTLVALVDDRVLVGVDLGDGDESWRVELPAVAAGAPVVAGDQVLVATLAGEVVAYEVGTDEPVWRVAVGGIPAGAPAVDGDTVLVVTRGGELVALR